MRIHRILAMPLLLCLGGGAAQAADYSGLLGGGYGSASGGVTGWEAMAAGRAHFGGLNAQGDITYATLGVTGVDAKIWQPQGSLFWSGSGGRIGASIAYTHTEASVPTFAAASASAAFTSYGAFGEWYAGPNFTLQAKGGGFSGDASGTYAGVGGAFYLFSHLALRAEYDYVQFNSLGHLNQIAGGLDFFVSPRFPAVLAVRYTRDTDSGGGDGILFSVTYLLGATQPDLVSWDRTGPARWTGGLAL